MNDNGEMGNAQSRKDAAYELDFNSFTLLQALFQGSRCETRRHMFCNGRPRHEALRAGAVSSSPVFWSRCSLINTSNVRALTSGIQPRSFQLISSAPYQPKCGRDNLSLLKLSLQIMPPHLHPRSALTTSLFTTTLAVSFLVVGMPHILPCPVDNRQYAEGSMEGLDVQRKRRRKNAPMDEASPTGEDGIACSVLREEGLSRRPRECPVPKPGGLIGQIMGFRNHDRERPVVKVENGKARPPKPTKGSDGSSG